jgi:hypothetical protein
VILAALNNNGSRIGPFRKVDIIFVLAAGLIVYGAAIRQFELVSAGVGLIIIPLAQRVDKP